MSSVNPTAQNTISAGEVTFLQCGLGNYNANAIRESMFWLRLPASCRNWEQAHRSATLVDTWLQHYVAEYGIDHQDLNFVANELMENALKYSQASSIEISAGPDIETAVLREPEAKSGSTVNAKTSGELHSPLRISMRHGCDTKTAESYRQIAERLIAADVDSLVEEIVLYNAENPDNDRKGAGLGLAMMRQNYGLQLGFAFSPTPDGVCVCTQVAWPSKVNLPRV